VNELQADFARWELNGRAVRQRMYGAGTARERERWHDGRAPRVGGLLDLGWTNARVAEALERDPHTVGAWLADFRRTGPESIAFEQSGGPPPRSTRSDVRT
jgi:hypothetical protein